MTLDKVRAAFRKTAESFQAWNPTTAECYSNNMICTDCSNKKFCQTRAFYRNPYDMPNIKYAALITYSNVGEKGIGKYIPKLAKDRARNKEEAKES